MGLGIVHPRMGCFLGFFLRKCPEGDAIFHQNGVRNNISHTLGSELGLLSDSSQLFDRTTGNFFTIWVEFCCSFFENENEEGSQYAKNVSKGIDNDIRK